MCRLLAVEGSPKHTFTVDTYLPLFAEECEYQLAPDDTFQKDGCGLSITVDDPDVDLLYWQNLSKALQTHKNISQFDVSQDDDGSWHVLYLSLLPIWTAVLHLPYKDFPNVKRMVAHARAASVADTKNELHFNQPHQNNELVFAFNGSLEKGSMNEFRNDFVRAGKFDRNAVPTQKIMALLQILYEQGNDTKFPMVVALQKLNQRLSENFANIHGMNIVAGTSDGLYALCGTHDPRLTEYYTLHSGKDAFCPHLSLVSSFPLEGQKLKSMKAGEVFYADTATQQSGIQPAMV